MVTYEHSFCKDKTNKSNQNKTNNKEYMWEKKAHGVSGDNSVGRILPGEVLNRLLDMPGAGSTERRASFSRL